MYYRQVILLSDCASSCIEHIEISSVKRFKSITVQEGCRGCGEEVSLICLPPGVTT